jgi:hypothetical protein
MELPSCLDCKYADQGYPCHKADGGFDFEKVGKTLVLNGRTYSVEGENLDPEVREQTAWAADCAFEIEQDYPHLLMPLVVAAMDACETPSDAAFVAAGVLENAVVKHGRQTISTIEALAERSAKFRYILSGIWARANADPDVWARVCLAVGATGLMDDDGRGPSLGDESGVLSDAEARALMTERVADVARGILAG